MDLKTVIDNARAIELTQREITFMKQNTVEPAEVNNVSKQQFQSKGDKIPVYRGESKDQQHQRNKSTVEVCKYCGQQTPHQGKCKARGATCNKCRKRGHFAVVCQSKPYKPVEQLLRQGSDDEDPQATYKFDQLTFKLDKVTTDTATTSPRPSEYETKVTVKLQDQRVQVQVDSGAEVHIMGFATYKALNKRPPLRNTNAKLKPYGSKPIPVKGRFRTTIRANGQQVESTFYVTENSTSIPILGKYNAFDLNILKIDVNELLQQKDAKSNPHHLNNRLQPK